MSIIETTPDLVVWADKSAMPQAKLVFSQLGAPVRTVPLESSKKRPDSNIFIFYLHGAKPHSDLHSAIKILKSSKKPLDLVVFYTSHYVPNFVFHAGMLVGREIRGNADWAFDLRDVKQLLRARNLLQHEDWNQLDARTLDIAAVRSRFGLTQEQMAHALNITSRTLQNWEKRVGTSQMLRKTRDLRELLGLLDDYVSSSEEQAWLNTPSAAFRDSRPIDLIVQGKIRDLIVEFQRLREGQPL